MENIGRNTPCPCGSGRKYKHCHGSHSKEEDSPQHSASYNPMHEMLQKLKSHEAKERQRKRQQGLGRGIVSTEFNGYRVIAVRNKLHWSNKWKTFHDFLIAYMQLVFGKDWWFSWIEKPDVDQHPVLLWAKLLYKNQQAITETSGEIRSMPATGAAAAYLTLAYDLYCLAHNEELQTKLIERLKKLDQFWGARYEVFTAATLIRAGFSLEFEDEDDRTSTHCEFTATCQATGRRFSVEAKHCAGTQFRFGRQLNRALRKSAKFERIVFIDVNAPDDATGAEKTRELLLRVVNDVRKFENRLINGQILPSAYLVISNNPHHHHLNTLEFTNSAIVEGFRISDFKHDATYTTLRAAVESKESHREIHSLVASMLEHAHVPSTFDGEIEEFVFSESHGRLLVGKRYQIEYEGKSCVGRLTSAVVDENKHIAWCTYEIEQNGASVVTMEQLSQDEINAWSKHPETFFGIVDESAIQPEGPVGIYEFLFRTYSKTSKEQLLAFLAADPNIDQLRQLDQASLAREYCIRMATTIHSRSSETSN